MNVWQNDDIKKLRFNTYSSGIKLQNRGIPDIIVVVVLRINWDGTQVENNNTNSSYKKKKKLMLVI